MLQANIIICYGLNCVSQKDMLKFNPHDYEYDLIWQSGLCRYTQVQKRSLGWALIQSRGETQGGEHQVKTQRHKGGRWPCEDRGSDWRYAAIGPGTPGATKSLKGQESYHPLAISEGVWPCPYLDFGLLASWTVKKYISVILVHPVCGTLFWQP